MNHSPFSKSTHVDRILVVDDSTDNLFLIQSLLEGEGYTIASAPNGMEALAKIPTFKPDLLLLDVMMPVMDGYEVTRQLRENASSPFIPILLITAYDQLSVARGLDIGADDFIRKPVEFDELLARVRSLLRLKHSVDERDEIARQREDFVSRLTHDLRTPLVAADRMLNLITQGTMGPISDEIKEALEVTSRSNQNLLQLVNLLLEVYRYEAGRKRLSFAAVDLAALAEEVIQELQLLAQEKGLMINLIQAPSSRAIVDGDRLELRRVLTNLIGNAIKFTDQGAIKVQLSTKQVRPGHIHAGAKIVQVQVQDTGPGISPEEQTRLFEGFAPGKHQRSASGLGLHLSRCIIEVHHGSITVESEVGRGSIFTVRLPAHPTEDATTAPRKALE